MAEFWDWFWAVGEPERVMLLREGARPARVRRDSDQLERSSVSISFFFFCCFRLFGKVHTIVNTTAPYIPQRMSPE